MNLDKSIPRIKVTPAIVNTKQEAKQRGLGGFPHKRLLQEVIEVIRRNLDNFALFGVTEVGLFGSFVRNEANKDSDIDLLVNHEFTTTENYLALIDFAESLVARRSVDIIPERCLNARYSQTICKQVEYV